MKNYFFVLLILLLSNSPLPLLAREEPGFELIDIICWCGIESKYCDERQQKTCNVSSQTVCSLLCPG